jgi:hypothetical protein
MRGLGPKGYQRRAERIYEDVCERLWHDGQVDASDVEVRVEDGVVSLSGRVDDRDQKYRAEELAEQVSGVRDVENHIKTRSGGWRSWLGLDAEEDRDRGRRRMARAGSPYADDSFSRSSSAPSALWTAAPGVERLDETIGYDAYAGDEHVGTVDEAQGGPGSFVVVDTGWWIFGKKRMVPAGLVRHVDHERRAVALDVDKQALSEAPDYEAETRVDDDVWQRVDAYFSRLHAGTR